MAKKAKIGKMAKKAKMAKIAKIAKKAKIAEIANVAETELLIFLKTFKIWVVFGIKVGFSEKNLNFNQSR